MHKDSDGRDESVLEAVYGRIVSPSMACPVPLDNAGARCELDADGASVEAPLLGSCELRIFHHGRGIRRGTRESGVFIDAGYSPCRQAHRNDSTTLVVTVRAPISRLPTACMSVVRMSQSTSPARSAMIHVSRAPKGAISNSPPAAVQRETESIRDWSK